LGIVDGGALRYFFFQKYTGENGILEKLVALNNTIIS
jgi:hypothetical protein